MPTGQAVRLMWRGISGQPGASGGYRAHILPFVPGTCGKNQVQLDLSRRSGENMLRVRRAWASNPVLIGQTG